MKSASLLHSRVTHLILALYCVACRKEPEPAPAAKIAEREPVAASSARPAASPVAPALPPPAPSFAETPPAPGQPGEWTDSASYKVKVGSIKRCPLLEAPAEGDVLGVSVDIQAKYDELLVASRDVTLTSGGIILKSELEPKVAPGCGSLLQTRQLGRTQIASGVVVFKVPPEFDARSMSVVYQATRWGGAPRVEVKVPAALVEALSLRR